jgi:hypothetical protein
MNAETLSRRRHQRFEVAGLGGRLVVPMEVQVVDLSLGGMALETNGYLQFGRRYSVHLENGGRRATLIATVAWCKLRGTKKNPAGEVVPVYRAGLRFQVLAGERLHELWEIIRDHAVVEVDDSVFGRFVPERPRVVELDSDYKFSVRKLSLSGMLIETDFVPELEARLPLDVSLPGSPWEALARIVSVPNLGRRSIGELTQVGVEFCGLDSESRSALKAYIAGHLDDAPTTGDSSLHDTPR